ncbi:uncharacterized protein PV06_00421 [Exophiala oligosperma]|uniref:Uncharacterized protein n=1 Tax=Exophiala oligosperma TaxID=215243 RepID=A0A0D2B653_9EURO|nr:uncharacterized protein PV06_00421 [Exophiala oligosperma]KIW47756.1 hypothetical protein PV06_00421 [Exophiala oligosperma]
MTVERRHWQTLGRNELGSRRLYSNHRDRPLATAISLCARSYGKLRPVVAGASQGLVFRIQLTDQGQIVYDELTGDGDIMAGELVECIESGSSASLSIRTCQTSCHRGLLLRVVCVTIVQ